MLKFNRKTEYALISLSYLAKRQSQQISAREINLAYKIPYPVLSKVLQKLNSSGLLVSVQGAKGGYRLARPLDEIKLMDVAELFEGSLGIVECIHEQETPCFLNDVCNIKSVFVSLNDKIYDILSQLSLADLVPMTNTTDETCHQVELA